MKPKSTGNVQQVFDLDTNWILAFSSGGGSE